MKKKTYKNVICLYRDEFAILTVYPKQIDLDEDLDVQFISKVTCHDMGVVFL